MTNKSPKITISQQLFDIFSDNPELKVFIDSSSDKIDLHLNRLVSESLIIFETNVTPEDIRRHPDEYPNRAIVTFNRKNVQYFEQAQKEAPAPSIESANNASGFAYLNSDIAYADFSAYGKRDDNRDMTGLTDGKKTYFTTTIADVNGKSRFLVKTEQIRTEDLDISYRDKDKFFSMEDLTKMTNVFIICDNLEVPLNDYLANTSDRQNLY